MVVPASPEALYPAVGMHSLGEAVQLDLQAEWGMEKEDGLMIVDSHEDEWGRLHDVRVTGSVRSWLCLLSTSYIINVIHIVFF